MNRFAASVPVMHRYVGSTINTLQPVSQHPFKGYQVFPVIGWQGQAYALYYTDELLYARTADRYPFRMPRPLLIDFPDAVYHVTSRGNGSLYKDPPGA